MRTFLSDLAVFEHDNLIRSRDGVKPVGDNQNGLIPGEGSQCLLYLVLTLGIGEGGGLVEQSTGASARIARAIAMRWRSPPESPLSGVMTVA